MLASNFELNFSFEGLQSTSVQICTYLDARLRLVNGMKCPAKTRVNHLFVTLGLAFVLGLFLD